ncbi:hypothetical protein C7W93_19580 [Glaciimonas sp. PCH181]|nr:hypothetical protein C7W93_19580 [Glaciimonas sp. PCH181]
MNALSALNFSGFVVAAFTANPFRNTPTTFASNLVSAATCHMDRARNDASGGGHDSYRQPCASGSKPEENYHAGNASQDANAQRHADNQADRARSSNAPDNYRQPDASGSKAREDYYGRNSAQESDDQRRAIKDLEASSRANNLASSDQGYRLKLSLAEAENKKNHPDKREYYTEQAQRHANLANFYAGQSTQSSQEAQALHTKIERRENPYTPSASNFESPIPSRWSDRGGDDSNQSRGPSALHPNR